MHLGDERAGGVKHEHPPIAGRLRHGFRHPMGGKHDRRVGLRDFVQFLDEDSPLGLEGFDHIAVMHDGVADIDGRAIFFERELDDLDRAVDARAESPR